MTEKLEKILIFITREKNKNLWDAAKSRLRNV